MDKSIKSIIKERLDLFKGTKAKLESLKNEIEECFEVSCYFRDDILFIYRYESSINNDNLLISLMYDVDGLYTLDTYNDTCVKHFDYKTKDLTSLKLEITKCLWSYLKECHKELP